MCCENIFSKKGLLKSEPFLILKKQNHAENSSTKIGKAL
jgi:hypothetical protein